MALSFGPQLEFVRWFAYYSGLNGNVVLAWALQEQPPGQPATAGSNNWLNIQYTDSGPNAEYFRIAAMTPRDAARASVEWTRRNLPTITAVLGRSPYDQAKAIVDSGWASSHYGGVAAFYAVVQRVERNEPVTTPAPGSLRGLKGEARAGVTVVNVEGNPPDRSPKIRTTGKQMGQHGTSFGGHAVAMRDLRNRHVPLRT